MMAQTQQRVLHDLLNQHFGTGASRKRLAREVRSVYIAEAIAHCHNKIDDPPRARLDRLQRDCGPLRGACDIFDHWYRREEAALLEEMETGKRPLL